MSSDERAKEYMANLLNACGAFFVPTIRNDTYPFIDPTKISLTGKSVFITGASRGIGRVLAKSYAQAGASFIGIGARSSLSSLGPEIQDAAKAVGRLAPLVLALQLDVTDQRSVEAAAAKVSEATGGSLDILISNAGYLESMSPFTESDPSEWKRAMDVNLYGTYLVARSFVPLLRNGTIKTAVMVTSFASQYPTPNCSAYSVAKLAQVRFAEYVGIENPGLVAYSVHPGAVPTEMGLSLPEERHPYLVDTVELPAHSIVWLTQECREWLAGRYVSVSWDLEKFLEKKEEVVKGDLLKVRMRLP